MSATWLIIIWLRRIEKKQRYKPDQNALCVACKC